MLFFFYDNIVFPKVIADIWEYGRISCDKIQQANK